MIRSNYFALLLALCLAGANCHANANSALVLPAIFSDGMVLQRREPVPVWGWAEPGAKVTVAFNSQKKTATADRDGKWQVKLDAMNTLSVGEKMIVVRGGESKTITDVVVGEVWFCSGQSNMDLPLSFLAGDAKEARYQPIADAIKAEIKSASDTLLRQFEVRKGASPLKVLTTTQGSWVASSPQTNGAFAATGYYFGKALRDELNVPVGLIKCAFGGTRIEAWISESGFNQFPGLKARYEKDLANLKERSAAWDPAKTERDHAERVKNWERAGKEGHKPFKPQHPERNVQFSATLYNAMAHPVIPYAVKGVIWYQGETNAMTNGAEYAVLFEALTYSWRQAWGKSDMPFYVAQLASWKGFKDWMLVCDNQRRAVGRIPNTGMAILNDVGETKDIHPKNKIDAGRRLALWALKHDYNVDVPAHCGPLYKNHQAKGDHVVVTFDHAESGLMVGRKELLNAAKEIDEPLKHFEICQFLGDWQPAQAEIIGKNQIKVWSDAVLRPQWVRYAWQSDLDGTMLYNREGLPASIFTSEPNVMDLALRSADTESLFQNLKKAYGIAVAAGSVTKPDGLPERIVVQGAVTASSVFEDQAAQHAIDGDPKTGWASNKDGKKAWLMIPLGKKYRITHIAHQARFGIWERIQSFRLDFGRGNLQLCYLDEKKPTDLQYFDIEDVETDVIRWSVLDSRYGQNTGATEIEIYGVPVD